MFFSSLYFTGSEAAAALGGPATVFEAPGRRRLHHIRFPEPASGAGEAEGDGHGGKVQGRLGLLLHAPRLRLREHAQVQPGEGEGQDREEGVGGAVPLGAQEAPLAQVLSRQCK